MAEDKNLSAVEYIDRFFDELRAEVRSNPKLAARLVRALGGNVVFEESAKAEAANPFLLAAQGSKAKFLGVFGAMKVAQLKKLLKDHNLATAVDMNGKGQGELAELLFTRASAKVSERKSSVF